MVGHKAKKQYRDFKHQEMNKKVIGKHKWSKEEKNKLKQSELINKDEYMKNHNGAYKLI